jgi:hypothetical protein
MSTTYKAPNRLKDFKCKKGQLSSRPPVPNVAPMDLLFTKKMPEILKMKLPSGTIFNISIFSEGNTKEYLTHIVAVLRVIKL